MLLFATPPSTTLLYHLLLLVNNFAYSSSSMELQHVVYMSRHGVRSPYPPEFGYEAYSNKPFPTAADWGMTDYDYNHQYLTAHGKKLVPLIGSYFRQLYQSSALFSNEKPHECPTTLQVYADDSIRDVQTARLFLEGFLPECHVEVAVANGSQALMEPVLSDHFNTSCPLATYEEMNGTFGGNFPALSGLYTPQIKLVSDILQTDKVAWNESVCSKAGLAQTYEGENCTLDKLPFQYNGVYYQGMALSPLYYASQFAETWFFQYLSGLENWGFNQISYLELAALYRMHIQVMAFGSNYYNSLKYASQTLGFILAVMEQVVTNTKIQGVPEAADDKAFTLLFNHDTNALYLKQLLDLDWLVETFALNSASTAGALVFELYKDDKGDYYVSLYYAAATPEQQRYNQTLTLENPPSKSHMIIRPCSNQLCPYSEFKRIVLDLIEFRCMEEPLRESLVQMYQSLQHADDDGNENCDNVVKSWRISLIVTATIVGLLIFGGIAFLLGRYILGQMQGREGSSDYRQAALNSVDEGGPI
mmetsp:Transcript_16368/g.26167  ORF Transcript_16368/g.26167 Transcript_16368/m.26167 type:complete len:532 (-) Transcript_16368:12-1607(-)